LHSDLAAHELDELPGDRKSQAGSPEAAGGRPVLLSEGLKDPLERRVLDADVLGLIADGHSEPYLRFVLPAGNS